MNARPVAAATSHGRPVLGIGLVALATLAFALSDLIVKHLAAVYPVTLIVAVRYVVQVALLLVFAWPRVGAGLWRTNRTWLVLGRGLVMALASLTMGLALKVMPLAETISILYVSPIVVMLLAGPLLGERVPRIGWLSAACGFAGVLLIVRPGGDLDPFGTLMALLNMGLATVYALSSRYLSRSESTVALLFHVSLVGLVFFGVSAIPDIGGPMPAPLDLAMMGLLGGLATLGHYLFTRAYREAPASLVAPVNYLHLVWAAGLGWLVLDHIPDPLALSGISLVLVAGVGIAFGHRSGRRN